MATEVASAYVSITAKTAGLTSGLAAADAKVRSFSQSADQAANRAGGAFGRMSRTMKAGTAVGVAAVVAGFASAVRTAASFEQQLSQLQAVSGANAKDMGRMRDAALDFGASTKFSAREVAAAQIELAKAGMSTSQVLGGSLKGSLALAAAGNIELADAASTVVNTMGQFGLGAKDATHIADALAEAANATTADVGDMGMALENVGPSAKAAGLGFDQAVVALELLAKSGTKGAEAGTNLRSMLNSIATPTAKSAKLMNELSLEFFDSAGNFKDMATVSTDLRRAFAGMTGQQKIATAAAIAGQYGQKALLSIMEGGPQLAREYARGLQQQGQAARTAQTMNDNLAGKMEQLGGALETIQIKVGSALIPVLAEGAVALAGFLDSVGQSEGLQSFATGVADSLRAVGVFIGDLGSAAAGAGPVLSAVGGGLSQIAAATAAVVGPLASVVTGFAGLPGVAQGAAAALVGLGVAMVAVKAASAGMAAAGSVSAFVSLAGSVRNASSAAALAGATFPKLAGMLSMFASPAGAAALAIGALAAGVALLAANSGPTVLQTMASELDRVAGAANAAKGAVKGFTDAAGAMTDADIELGAAQTSLRVQQEALNKARKDGTATAAQLAQMESNVEQATRRVDKARQASAQSQREVVKQGLDGVVALSRLATESGRVNKNLGDLRRGADSVSQAFGITSQAGRQITQEQIKLAQSGANVDQRMNALRNSFRKVAGEMNTSTAAGRQAKATLTAVANLDNAGLVRFAGSLQDLQAKGVPAGRAVQQALEAAAKPRKARLSADDQASPKAETVKRSITGIPLTRTVTINAVDNASGTLGGVLSLLSSIPTSRTTTVTTVKRTRTEDSVSKRSMSDDGRPGPAETGALDRQISAVTSRLARLEAAQNAAARKGMTSAQRRDADRAAQIQASGDRLSALETARQAKIDKARESAEKKADAARSRLEAVRDKAFAAMSSSILGAFDRETQGLLDGIASTYDDGFRKIGDTFELVPGLFAQLAERTKTASAGLRSALDADLSAIDARARQLTKSEKALAELQAGKQEDDLQQNLRDAEAALAASNGRDVEQRLRDVEEAKFAIKVAALEKSAAAERAAVDAQAEAERSAAQKSYDDKVAALERSAEAERMYLQSELDRARQAESDRREVERTGLENRLEEWQANFKRGGALWGAHHQNLLKQTGEFSEGFRTSGKNLGNDWARGLRDSYPALRNAATGAADIIRDYLKLNSPAEKGPLSTLDKWWKAFGPTLVSGADMRAADVLMSEYSNPFRGGSIPRDANDELVKALSRLTAALLAKPETNSAPMMTWAPPSSDSLVNLGVGA